MDEGEVIRKTLREHPELDPALRKVLEDKLKPAQAPEEDDEMVVLCGYWPSVINGSKLVLCHACKTRCCIAPSTQEQLGKYAGSVKLLCLQCFQSAPPDGMPEALRAMLEKLQKD